MRRVLIVLTLFLFVGGIGYWWFSRDNTETVARPLWKTEIVRRGNLEPEVTATGTVVSAKNTVLFWQVTGRVESIASLGESVKAGDVVARIAPDSWPQSLVSARAQLVDLRQQWERLQILGEAQAWQTLAEARYQEDRARQNLESIYDKIADGESISQLTVERYESAKALATAQREYAETVYQRWKEGKAPELEALQAQIEALEALLATAELTAPFDGTVTWVYTPTGTVVQPGMQALRLDDLRTLYVEADINEFDAAQVREGQKATFTFDGIPYTVFEGIVEEVALVGTVDVQSGLIQFRVRIRMENPDEQVKPGMTAAVTIYGDIQEDVLLVPSRAIRVVEGQPTVYVLRDGVPTPVPVKVGLSSEAYTQILEGDLREGDPVVLNPPTESAFGP